MIILKSFNPESLQGTSEWDRSMDSAGKWLKMLRNFKKILTYFYYNDILNETKQA